VLASDVGGHRELIEDGRTGYLFAPDDPDAIVGALQGVLQRRAEWETVRRTAREFVENERSWRRSASRYPAVYEAARRMVVQ